MAGPRLETAFGWHGTPAAALAEMSETSRDFQASTAEPYPLQTGDVDLPWPRADLPDGLVGYELDEPLPAHVRDAYDIRMEDGRVMLSQEARAFTRSSSTRTPTTSWSPPAASCPFDGGDDRGASDLAIAEIRTDVAG